MERERKEKESRKKSCSVSQFLLLFSVRRSFLVSPLSLLRLRTERSQRTGARSRQHQHWKRARVCACLLASSIKKRKKN